MKFVIIGLTPQGLSVLRTLSRAGADVYAFYQNARNVGAHSKYGKKIQFADATDLKMKIHQLVKTFGEKPLCYITSGELLALILREYPELYSDCNVIAGPYETIEKLAHKDLMYKIAINKGFSVAKYLTLKNYADGDLRFPLFIKRNYEIPLFFKADRIDNEQILHKYLERINENQKKDIILQELIDIAENDLMEISAQIVFSSGTVCGSLVAEQYHKLKKGLTAAIVELSDSVLKSRIVDLCTSFMSDLRYTGFAEFEFMYNKRTDDLFFLEVNTRTCGEHSALAYKFLNLQDYLINPFKPIVLVESVKQLKWMNIIRDIRCRFQKKDFKNLCLIFDCKYDVLDLHDIAPFFRQII